MGLTSGLTAGQSTVLIWRSGRTSMMAVMCPCIVFLQHTLGTHSNSNGQNVLEDNIRYVPGSSKSGFDNYMVDNHFVGCETVGSCRCRQLPTKLRISTQVPGADSGSDRRPLVLYHFPQPSWIPGLPSLSFWSCDCHLGLRHVEFRHFGGQYIICHALSFQGSILFSITPGFSQVGIVTDDAASRRGFLGGISHVPRSSISALLHSHIISPVLALMTSLLRATQIPQLKAHYNCITTKGSGQVAGTTQTGQRRGFKKTLGTYPLVIGAMIKKKKRGGWGGCSGGELNIPDTMAGRPLFPLSRVYNTRGHRRPLTKKGCAGRCGSSGLDGGAVSTPSNSWPETTGEPPTITNEYSQHRTAPCQVCKQFLEKDEHLVGDVRTSPVLFELARKDYQEGQVENIKQELWRADEFQDEEERRGGGWELTWAAAADRCRRGPWRCPARRRSCRRCPPPPPRQCPSPVTRPSPFNLPHTQTHAHVPSATTILNNIPHCQTIDQRDFRRDHENKSSGDRSGDRGGHSTDPYTANPLGMPPLFANTESKLLFSTLTLILPTNFGRKLVSSLMSRKALETLTVAIRLGDFSRTQKSQRKSQMGSDLPHASPEHTALSLRLHITLPSIVNFIGMVTRWRQLAIYSHIAPDLPPPPLTQAISPEVIHPSAPIVNFSPLSQDGDDWLDGFTSALLACSHSLPSAPSQSEEP
ncbi:hypothetical protein PR048_021433 [Dryococelus australis]|uniref:Uncharacterized protein n=1 Tax=Dryococelus australis TaxID=614101 RepID=A0ABQ9GYD3_9NEOP|nr:hypothetical protein PR048_021433 [Dryococelus australis]